MSRNSSDSIFWGIVIIIIGFIFLAKNMEWIHINAWEVIGTYWPLVLIYIGSKNIILFFKKNR